MRRIAPLHSAAVESRVSRAHPVGQSRWLLPDPGSADVDGLVAFGADLEAPTLVDAYRHGLFPWPHEGVAVLPWFSPDPRGVVDLTVGQPAKSRSMRQRLRRSGWTTTVDGEFDAVVEACSQRRGTSVGDADDDSGTWINESMRTAYGRLHRLGWAHSVEVWSHGAGDRLVGGLYGVTVGGCWTGESMFHVEPDASKVAFVDLCSRWAEAGGTLVDVQIPTDHLLSLGAVAVDRHDFINRLAEVRDDDVRLIVDRLDVARLAAAISA